MTTATSAIPGSETHTERFAKILAPASIALAGFAVLVLVHGPRLSDDGKVIMAVGFTSTGVSFVAALVALVALGVDAWPEALARWGTRTSAVTLAISASAFTWTLIGWVFS